MVFFSSTVLAAAIALLCSAIPWVNFFIIALVKSSMVFNLHCQQSFTHVVDAI